ncbi:hypothetical protein [Candidatus Synchoanobacter obligatus]|uniref:Uncharacterized protein n=1 Tax=Candidatus Synchoanobacter obligatus TaxID=2919597 RepID=A0ABT1L6U0_9GAMM|nr:hypothetical protein [Candidatus Synchoanobacter obligatus]MCP8352611.1 hypothetical protein [Candidatus Synchoanobacter obligatus]
MQQRILQLLGLTKNTFKGSKTGFVRLDLTQNTQGERFPDSERAVATYKTLYQYINGRGMI